MSINNSRQWLAPLTEGYNVTNHRLVGSNIQLAPGTYVTNWNTRNLDVVTFTGTAGNDILFGRGGEFMSVFLGSPGNDLYGATSVVDYSGAPRGVTVDMTYRDIRSFIDANGETQTVWIVGRAQDGFGGTDYFAENFRIDYRTAFYAIGTKYDDVMIAELPSSEDTLPTFQFYGGHGNDLLIGPVCHGGSGHDTIVSTLGAYGGGGNDLIIMSPHEWGGTAFGGNGNDTLIGSGWGNGFYGGAGNDRIFTGDGYGNFASGDTGNDYVHGGTGGDHIEGGSGRDTLVSGAGNDLINPDIAYFFEYYGEAASPNDGIRDIIRVTRDDTSGAYTDTVIFKSFEAGSDEIRFRDAVRGGVDFRVYYQESIWYAGEIDTVLQIDRNGDGFDYEDYFLIVEGVELSLQDGFILT